MKQLIIIILCFIWVPTKAFDQYFLKMAGLEFPTTGKSYTVHIYDQYPTQFNYLKNKYFQRSYTFNAAGKLIQHIRFMPIKMYGPSILVKDTMIYNQDGKLVQLISKYSEEKLKYSNHLPTRKRRHKKYLAAKFINQFKSEKYRYNDKGNVREIIYEQDFSPVDSFSYLYTYEYDEKNRVTKSYLSYTDSIPPMPQDSFVYKGDTTYSYLTGERVWKTYQGRKRNPKNLIKEVKIQSPLREIKYFSKVRQKELILQSFSGVHPHYYHYDDKGLLHYRHQDGGKVIFLYVYEEGRLISQNRYYGKKLTFRNLYEYQ